MSKTYNQQSMSTILHSDNVVDTICNLAFRWQDESQYEDINEYGKTIKSVVNKAGLEIGSLTMTKRPFGFKAVVDYTYKNGETYPSMLQVKVTASGQYSWSIQPV